MKKLVTLVAAVSIASMTALAYGEMGGHGMGPGMMSGCGMDGQMTEPTVRPSGVRSRMPLFPSTIFPPPWMIHAYGPQMIVGLGNSP